LYCIVREFLGSVRIWRNNNSQLEPQKAANRARQKKRKIGNIMKNNLFQN